MAVIETSKGHQIFIDEDKVDELSSRKWCLSNGYPSARINKSLVYLHRYLMQPRDGQVVDHINGNKLDNRVENLRVCSVKDNSRNRSGVKTRSGHKGIIWDKFNKKWLAAITVDRKYHNLGRFLEKEQAIEAYNRAAVKYFGEFAWLNQK